MYIVHVSIYINPVYRGAFRAATVENACKSLLEPGIARFDFIEQIDDPDRFILVEVYRTPEDALKHKETPHYAVWRDTVAPMMAKPRSSTKFSNIIPDDAGWDSQKP